MYLYLINVFILILCSLDSLSNLYISYKLICISYYIYVFIIFYIFHIDTFFADMGEKDIYLITNWID